MADDKELEIVEELVSALQKSRTDQGLSKYRVADLSGLDARTIGRIESYERNPTLYSLLKIAKAQGVKVSTLLSDLE